VLKKYVSIILLSIYLISLTELSQLVKLPLLIEHFSEHKQKDGHMSFWKFLQIHYSQNKLNDADYEKDMKLPFKSHDGCINSIVSESVPTSYYFISSKPVFSHSNSYSSYTEQFLTSAYLTSIWQPPKSC
jgi:hypothetical protein